jgi:hypothetical protein
MRKTKAGEAIYRVCRYCNKRIYTDMEGDLVHLHLDNKGVDPRMCEPNNPDSKIAEELTD